MLVPLGHHILVRPEDIDEKTQGGLYLAPSTMERRKNERVIGEIVAVGMNAWKAFDSGEPWAAVGDKILYARYGGVRVKDPDTQEELIVMHDEDAIVAIK